MQEELKQTINQMATYLAEGEKWHSRTANQLRIMPNKRGYARIHDDQSIMDAGKLIHLNKMLRDYLKYTPIIDTNYVSKAELYTITTFEDFKKHFDTWMDREKIFKDITNRAISLIRDEDMTLYQEFCNMAKELKIEYMRAEWIKLSLLDCDWEKHHCAVVSKWLHEQAESNPGDWNFNIG